MIGKFLSRVSIVGLGLVIAFGIGAATAPVLVPTISVDYVKFTTFAGLTLLYGLAYVSIAVGISAVTGSRSRAMGGAIGFYFVFNLVWNVLPVGPVQMVEFLIEQFGYDPSKYDNLLELIFSLSPTGAYLNATTKIVMDDEFAKQVGSAIENQPWFLEGWFMVTVLIIWCIIPIFVALRRFERVQIG